MIRIEKTKTRVRLERRRDGRVVYVVEWRPWGIAGFFRGWNAVGAYGTEDEARRSYNTLYYNLKKPTGTLFS